MDDEGGRLPVFEGLVPVGIWISYRGGRVKEECDDSDLVGFHLFSLIPFLYFYNRRGRLFDK